MEPIKEGDLGELCLGVNILVDSRIHCGTGGVCFSTPGLAIYVRYIVPLRLENHSLVIHLCEIYCTSAVGKSYLRHPFM